MKLIAKSILIFFIATVTWSCNQEEDTFPKNVIEVEIKNSEDYRYDFTISGDEEGATIITQAKHYEISEFIRNSSTNWSVAYHYKPERNYVGTDYVEVETCTGGVGVNCSNIEIVKIHFTITN